VDIFLFVCLFVCFFFCSPVFAELLVKLSFTTWNNDYVISANDRLTKHIEISYFILYKNYTNRINKDLLFDCHGVKFYKAIMMFDNIILCSYSIYWDFKMKFFDKFHFNTCTGRYFACYQYSSFHLQHTHLYRCNCGLPWYYYKQHWHHNCESWFCIRLYLERSKESKWYQFSANNIFKFCFSGCVEPDAQSVLV